MIIDWFAPGSDKIITDAQDDEQYAFPGSLFSAPEARARKMRANTNGMCGWAPSAAMDEPRRSPESIHN